MAITVTATQSGAGSANGMALTVKVVTGALPAASQNGTVVSNNTTVTTCQSSITPAATGSWIYGALANGSNTTTFTANGSTTLSANIQDLTNAIVYGTCRSTGTTTASTPVTVGASAPSGTAGQMGISLAEIKAATTLAESGTAPATVSTTSAKTVTTASFTPPGNALLVAMVSNEYSGTGTNTITVSDSSGLTWTQLTHDGYAITSVWVAQVPNTVSESDVAGAVDAVSASATVPLADVAGAVDSISVSTGTASKSMADVAGAVDSIIVTHPFGDAAGAVDSISVVKGTPDFAGAVDTISVTSVGTAVPFTDAAGAYDQIAVQKTPASPQTPALSTLSQAPKVFVRSTMPRMHVQNLISGAWLHRDVQGITSPSVTWSLNAADSFTCTLSPPRADMMTSGGEPLLVEWRDACYLEEDGEIKWGGILTSSTFNGPAWQQTWTGFSGFPNGMVYEGGVYKKLGVEAMDVVRFLWDWVQSGQGASANLNMQMPNTNTGYLLGAQVPAGVKDTLAANSSKGQNTLTVNNPNAWNRNMVLRVTGDGETYIIKSISGHVLTLTTTLKGSSSLYRNKNTVQQVVPPTPYELDWWNSTDIGQEIEAIRAEAIFDWRETHAWGSSRDVVKHSWVVGAPRLGMYRRELRFAEGENVIQPATVTRDGSKYAQRVIGIGNGQGNQAIRTTVTGDGGRLARSVVYTDQTVKNVARMTSVARRVQRSMNNIDSVTQITVKNHPHAPFGSFFVGDDIDVILCTGWRNTSIKSRILSMTQDPTTSLMTLTLDRSDNFTYMAQSGQDGTL